MKTGIEPAGMGSDALPGACAATVRGLDSPSECPSSSSPRGSKAGTTARRSASRHVATPSEDAPRYRSRVETPKYLRDELRDRMDERAMLARGEAAWSAARPSKRTARTCRASMGR